MNTGYFRLTLKGLLAGKLYSGLNFKEVVANNILYDTLVREGFNEDFKDIKLTLDEKIKKNLVFLLNEKGQVIEKIKYFEEYLMIKLIKKAQEGKKIKRDETLLIALETGLLTEKNEQPAEGKHE